MKTNNFISHKNQLNFDCIDFENNTIMFVVGNDIDGWEFVAFNWTGGVVFFMDYAPDLGNFVDYNFIGEVNHSPELSDSVDKEVLKALEYNKEYIIEYIAQQTYIKEMNYRSG
ncbi:MAG: hypothetical protein RSB94_08600, partial [Erysipelotrichaceae bacterium]